MACIRCTCIYRPATGGERAASGATIVVACRDPHCPASAVHDRAAGPQEGSTVRR